MKNLLQDLRFALRHLRRSPGFAVTAVLILGLGIAANVIVFGVLQNIVLQPLDAPRADRVVTFANRAGGYPIYSYPEVRDVRDGNTVFSAVAADAITTFGLEVNGVSHAWGLSGYTGTKNGWGDVVGVQVQQDLEASFTATLSSYYEAFTFEISP